jgi:light-regulated signal transduction histidine kinase (bacteriophytochrome)
MPVPLPRMCSVLAHELRSPLSVLQGYIRLLQRQREAGHPEIPMLEAMLDATGRLTTIARQASDLGNWLAAVEARPLAPIPVTAVTDALAERLRNASPAIALLPVPSTPLTLRADSGVLAGAILALAESMHRDNESAVIEISLIDSQADGSVGFALGPAASAPGSATSPNRSTPAREPSFDRGGAGLALVAASHVFDEHGASFETATEPGHIVIRFPHSGGSQ